VTTRSTLANRDEERPGPEVQRRSASRPDEQIVDGRYGFPSDEGNYPKTANFVEKSYDTQMDTDNGRYDERQSYTEPGITAPPSGPARQSHSNEYEDDDQNKHNGNASRIDTYNDDRLPPQGPRYDSRPARGYSDSYRSRGPPRGSYNGSRGYGPPRRGDSYRGRGYRGDSYRGSDRRNGGWGGDAMALDDRPSGRW
jgi:hypothetical protein